MAAKKSGSPKKAVVKKEKTKRGLSSYIMYVKENRDKVIKEYGLDPKQVAPVATKMGELWKKLSKEEQAEYKKKADAHNAANK